jgi:hypothetical protein
VTTEASDSDVTYVHVARRLAFSGSAVTLLDLSPATVFFTSSGAVVGYLTTGMFLDRWYAESSGSSTRVVTAVLSVLDPEQEASSDAHLRVCLPRIRSAGLEYQVTGVTGDAPPRGAGACVLFIGATTVPLTPRESGRRGEFHVIGGSRAPAAGGTVTAWARGAGDGWRQAVPSVDPPLVRSGPRGVHRRAAPE